MKKESNFDYKYKINIDLNKIKKGRQHKKENEGQNREEIILAEKHIKYDHKDYNYYDQNNDINIIFKTQTISKKVIFYQ